MFGLGTGRKKKENEKKRRSKTPKESGRESRAQSSASQPVSSDDLPEDFGFLWSIDAIETICDGKHPPRMLGLPEKHNDVAKLWFPPNRTSRFRLVQEGKLYQWRDDGSELAEDPTRPERKFAVASVFFQAKQDNFVACYSDCTSKDISGLEVGWCYLGFNHRDEGVSEVEIWPNAERHLLAAPARGSSWMPQVLPEVYDYDTKGRTPVIYKGPSGGLCGRLALLIGMAAFSADVEHAEEVVGKCFTFGAWLKHNLEIGIGRYQERGVVVSIYLDPDAPDTKSTHLRNFEKGCYGPIFATFPGEEEPQSTEGTSAYSLSSARVLTTASTIPRGLASTTSPNYGYTRIAHSTIPPVSETQSEARSETEEGDDGEE